MAKAKSERPPKIDKSKITRHPGESDEQFWARWKHEAHGERLYLVRYSAGPLIDHLAQLINRLDRALTSTATKEDLEWLERMENLTR